MDLCKLFAEVPRHAAINPEQYFREVPPEVWTHTIGGYQPAEKWLKDRRDRTLTTDDLRHYQRVLIAIAETRATMPRIDAVIESHGGFPEPSPDPARRSAAPVAGASRAPPSPVRPAPAFPRQCRNPAPKTAKRPKMVKIAENRPVIVKLEVG